MPRSLLDQLTQVDASSAYNDAISTPHAAGVAEAQTSLEGDMNVFRTLMKDLSGTTNWYDDITTDGGLTVKGLNDKFFIQIIHPSGFDNVTMTVAGGAGGSTTAFDTAIKTITDHNNGAGDSTTSGVVVDDNFGTSGYKIAVRDHDSQDPIGDGNNNEVYGRLSWSGTDYVITWYSVISGTETAYTFADGSYTLDISYVPLSRQYKDLSWERFLDFGWHDVAGIVGTISDENVITNSPSFSWLLTGDTNQEQVNITVDTLGKSDDSAAGADLIGIDDTASGTNGYFTGTFVMPAFEELVSQLGGTTSTTFDFTDTTGLGPLTDNMSVYPALDALNTYWAQLQTINTAGQGANLVGVQDANTYFTATTVEGVLNELYEALENVTGWEKEVYTTIGTVGAGTPVTIPNSKTYTIGAGANMDVYDDGQLLVEGAGNDYQEIDGGAGTGTTVSFNYTIRINTNITFMIRQ